MAALSRRFPVGLALLAGMLAGGNAPAEEPAPAPRRILCLISADEEPYTIARDAFLERLREEGIPLRRADVVAATSGKLPEDRLWVDGGSPDLIFAAGTRAALAAQASTKTVPIVFTLVLNPEKAGLEGGNLCGVSIRVPFPRVLSLVREGLPETRRIAILHRREEARPDFLQLQREPPADLRIRFVPVADDRDVPDALERIGDAEALLAFPDNAIYSQAALGHIQTFCLQRRIHLIGFSTPMTEGGAVLSVAVDFRRLGTQGARQALRILSGKSRAEDLGLEDPEALEVSVNQPVARRMGHRFPEAFLDKVQRSVR